MLANWFVLSIIGYFVACRGSYLLLNVLALSGMRRIEQTRVLADLPHIHSGLEPPVSMLLVAHDDANVVASVFALLELNYPQHEIVVIIDDNHGSTLDLLTDAFDLLPFPEAYRIQLQTGLVKRIHRSTRYSNLRVIGKTAGSRADALNAGVNAARYPLVCVVDEDVVLQRDSLHDLVMPFLGNTAVIATVGAIRITEDTPVADMGTTRRTLFPRFQVIEHLRTGLFAPLGWSAVNAMLAAPRGIQLLKKDVLIEIGGYRTDACAADTDMILRMHNAMRKQSRSYQVRFIGDVIGWQTPCGNLASLKARRIACQLGLSDSAAHNLALLTGRQGKSGVRIAFACLLAFEWWGPLIETLGYLVIAAGFLLGAVSPGAIAAFLSIAIGMGILLSVSSLLLEEISFRAYSEKGDIGKLMSAAVIENLGYRQLSAYWRSVGLIRWLLQGKGKH